MDHRPRMEPRDKFYGNHTYNRNGMNRNGEEIRGLVPNITYCSVPYRECLRNNQTLVFGSLGDAVRVYCTNERCTSGTFMHKECYEAWERSILAQLKADGRGRAWSDKQIIQHLWSRKTYDFIFKSCLCNCGRGYLKKDLDWTKEDRENELEKRKNRQRTRYEKPPIVFNKRTGGVLKNGTFVHFSAVNPTNGDGCEENVLTSVELQQQIVVSSSDSDSAITSEQSDTSLSDEPLPGTVAKSKLKRKKKIDVIAAFSGCGIFYRRTDYDEFNILPKYKWNSCHVKFQDEDPKGNDDARKFVLSNLNNNKQCKMTCVVCALPMKVYHTYPLIGGTFFLSPAKHSKGSIEVVKDGQNMFLSAVCVKCLEGTSPGSRICCKFCKRKFDGGSIMLGGLYAYDIFAAMPCCQDRKKCISCEAVLLRPTEQLKYFSDYSRKIICPRCNAKDYHFIRHVTDIFALESPT